MKKSNNNLNDENLIILFKIILNDKIKIFLITFIITLIGFGYSYKSTKYNIYSMTVKPSLNSEFKDIEYLAEIAELNFDNKLNLVIFEKFLSEINDYDEFKIAIKNSKEISHNILKLSLEEQNSQLINLFKSFEIIEQKKEDAYKLNFQSKYNDNESINIIKDTFNLTLINLENSIFKELRESIEFKRKFNMQADIQRLEFLNEQRDIAVELDISDNYLMDSKLNQLNQSNSVLFNINTSLDLAYYLRGYIAINKEIELISSRNYKYLNNIVLELDLISKKQFKWIDFNYDLIDIERVNHSILILIVSIMLGLFVGVFYVIISNFVQTKTSSKNKLN